LLIVWFEKRKRMLFVCDENKRMKTTEK